MTKQLRAIACGALSLIVLATALIPLDTSYAYVSDKFNGYEEGREYNTSELYDIKFRTSKLGLYGMTIESHEIPSNEWLTFISHDYFSYTTLSDQTEVDNTAPSAVYSAQGIVKVDVVFATGELSQMDRLEGYTDTFTSILEQAGNNFDVQVTAVETVTSGFDMNEVDASTIFNSWEQYPSPNSFELTPDGKYLHNHGNEGSGFDIVLGGVNYTTNQYHGYDQAFIDPSSADAQEIELEAWIAPHPGVGCSGGIVFHWDKKTDIGYMLAVGSASNSRCGIYRVTGLSGFWGTWFNGDLGYNIGSSFSGGGANGVCIATGAGGIGKYNLKVDADGNIVVEYDGREVIRTKHAGAAQPGYCGLFAVCTIGISDVAFSYSRTVTKSLGESIQDVAWRDGSVRFVVHATDIIPMECDPSNPTHEEDYAYTVAKLLNANCYLVNLGNSINKSQLDRLVAAIREADGTSKGTFYYNNSPNIETAMNNSANYIISIAKQFEKPVDWILVNTEILWNTIYSDSENDPPLNLGEHNGQNAQPQDTSDIALGQSYGLGNAGSTLQFDESKILAERWRYRHYNSFFDNSPVQVSWHEVWIEDPVSIFEYPGKYRINYKRRDNPLYPSVDLSDPFDSYRYWSTDYDYAT